MAATVIYSFVPCCDPTAEPLQFNQHGVFLPTVPGVYTFTGVPQLGLENGVCYTVTSTPATVPNPTLPNIPSVTNFQLITEGCEAEECLCTPQCFQLTSCNGVVIFSEDDLILYNNQFVSLVQYPGECFFVELLPQGSCGSSPQKVDVDPDIPCSCPCICYIITGSGVVSYLECGGETLTAFAPAQFCSISYPEVLSGTETIEIFDNGPCDDVNGCPEKCFLLTNCDPTITETITSNSFTLLTHALNNEIVVLVGYEGCWVVEETEDCECAVAVTVVQSFSSCETCSPPPAYKLTNCENSAQILYTYQDLSAYLDKVVELDCGGCWKVELLTTPPPSVQNVTVLANFGTCEECLAIYWELTDCTGVKDPIYTSQDLSAYEGQIVQLDFCPDVCWSVELAETPVNPGNVYINQQFERCSACLIAIFTCSCKTIKYIGTQPNAKIAYINCSGQIVEVVLQPGQSTPKTCMLTLATPLNIPLEVTDFGACIDGECPPPPPIGPKRQVKPGYSVPACNTEKYEKITCKASEIYYKTVLQRRYGISNCCPDEDDKWLIKKELIDLQGLIDPDYTCTAIASCCNQTISNCGCGCNSKPLVTTCNS